jgi:hypothetical protein
VRTDRTPSWSSYGGCVTLIEVLRGYAVVAFRRVTNPGLAALITGAGFRSMERFAEAVNHRGWHAYGMRLSYDHISVRRWLRGGICRHVDIVADVISAAWGVPVSPHMIWPELRDGAAAVPAHLQAWTAARTLEDLAALIGSDMLTRREILTGAIGVASGPTLLTPMTRWLDTEPTGLTDLRPGAAEPAGDDTDRRIGDSDVDRIEESIRLLAAQDAQTGGGLSREAAVGQLKYATDLVRYATHTDAVGNRLLAAVAGLAGLAGWMSLDSGMAGPSQQYLLYGLQAARESTDPRAPLLVVRLLADLAQHQRCTGNHETSVRLLDLAINKLPVGQHHAHRAEVIGEKAHSLAHLGSSVVTEARNCVSLSRELHAQATNDDPEATAALPHRNVDLTETEMAAKAACTYLLLAAADPRFAGAAQEQTLYTLANPTTGQGRNGVRAQIRLARLRFLGGDAEQGCVDGGAALAMAATTVSTMVTVRLGELYIDTQPYGALPDVAELRDQLHTTIRSRP